MSDCEHMGRLSAYYDGEMDAEERRELEKHLGRCPSCARELGELRRLSELFAAVPMPQMSAGAMERLHSNLGSMREAVIVRMARIVAAAAAAVLIVCSVWLWASATRQESYAASAPAWEPVAVTLQNGTPPSADTETELMEWIVQSLSRENGND